MDIKYSKNLINQSPLLSVITVVKNDAERLLRTIKSVAAYKGQLTEYIVVDGGSVDRTIDLISQNMRLIDVFVSEPDDGIYDAMNKGIDLASGKYLIFINAGDELLMSLDKIVSSLSEDVVIGYGKVKVVSIDGAFVKVRGKRIRNIKIKKR